MEQPPKFEDPKYSRDKFICMLNQGLYNLKQSPLHWSNDVKSNVLNLGYKQSNAVESIFILLIKLQSSLFMLMISLFILTNLLKQINNLHYQLS